VSGERRDSVNNPHLDIDRIIDDRRIRIVVCCGRSEERRVGKECH
jgi:hypothetical protein